MGGEPSAGTAVAAGADGTSARPVGGEIDGVPPTPAASTSSYDDILSKLLHARTAPPPAQAQPTPAAPRTPPDEVHQVGFPRASSFGRRGRTTAVPRVMRGVCTPPRASPVFWPPHAPRALPSKGLLA